MNGGRPKPTKNDSLKWIVCQRQGVDKPEKGDEQGMSGIGCVRTGKKEEEACDEVFGVRF
jgi:hypothetical protein